MGKIFLAEDISNMLRRSNSNTFESKSKSNIWFNSTVIQ